MENRDVDKRGFESKELADEELRRIIETNYNVCKELSLVGFTILLSLTYGISLVNQT